MQFHQYIAYRQRALSELGQETQTHAATLQSIREMDSYTFAVTQAHATEEMIRQAPTPAERDHLRMQFQLLIAEQQWHLNERPFYNVWPVVHDVVKLLDIDIPWDRLQLPFHTLMLNFAKGNEPFGLATMMMCILKGGESGESKEQIVCFEGYNLQWQEHGVFGRLISDNSTSINETVFRHPSKTIHEGDDVLAFALRLACFISLIAEGNDIITPVLLKKDEARVEELPAELLQEWLKRRAEKAKQQHVFGFDVGKALQAKKDSSPTFVMPYWAVRWTGKGGAIPRYVEVSSHLKNVNPLMDMPTGFLGHETAEELREVFVAYENTETVYFLRDGERPYVKIGYTQRNLASRLRELSTANRHLRLLGLIATGNGRRKESDVHAELRNTIRDGEFFYLSNGVCREIVLRHGGRWLGDEQPEAPQ